MVGTLDPRIEPGQVMSVTGPSGWGNQWCWVRGVADIGYAGFECQAGHLLDGRDFTQTPAAARGIGMMPHQAAMFPHLSVADRLTSGISCEIRRRAVRLAAVYSALCQVKLAGLGWCDPVTLAAEQRARTALMCRRLACHPAGTRSFAWSQISIRR